MDLRTRSHEPEIMDDLACAGPVVEQTLRELDFINQWLGGNAVTMGPLRAMLRAFRNRPCTVADLGCGSGDMIARVVTRARAQQIDLHGIGIDANPHIIDYASRTHGHVPHLSFQTADVFSPHFRQQSFDIVLATLFLHHFTHAQLVDLLRALGRQTRHAIIINDLHRHPLAYYSIRWLTQAFSKSSMVKFDAPLSVRRGFSRAEWQGILAEAGMAHYRLRWKWAFRWQIVIWQSPPAS